MAGSVGQYTQGWFPWAATKANTGWSTRNQDGTALGMGWFKTNNTAQNNAFSNDFWLDSVTWKAALIHYTSTDRPIYSVQFDGVTQGTIDGYSAGSVLNVYSEVTGISVTTASLKVVQVINATKNASSSAYNGNIMSIALIRTGGTPSVPAGTDTPGYTWEWIPWMGSKAHTGWDISNRQQGSGYLGGGRLRNDAGAQNSYIECDTWQDTGTYKYAHIYNKNADEGTYSIRIDGVEKGTIDAYNAAASDNNYSEVTAITVATAGVKTFRLQMATKNASSSGYWAYVQSTKWIRTGV